MILLDHMLFKLPKSITKQLRSLGVHALYSFGSRAQGLAGPLSDYDFAVLMNKSGHRRGDNTYDQLYDLLEPFCPRTLENDVIDIIFLRDTPLELSYHVIRYGQVIFDSNPIVRNRFEYQTMLEYCDFQPLLNMFDKAILATI